MTDNRPIWLLDVDGVLNACDTEFPVTFAEHLWNYAPVGNSLGTFPIRWCNTVIDFINNINNKDVEVRWLTTWQLYYGALDSLRESLGLDEFSVQNNGSENAYRWWKMDFALKAAAENRPLIWTDDDLTSIQREIFQKNSTNTNTLLIQPHLAVGLTPDHLASIEDFVLAHKNG